MPQSRPLQSLMADPLSSSQKRTKYHYPDYTNKKKDEKAKKEEVWSDSDDETLQIDDNKIKSVLNSSPVRYL